MSTITHERERVKGPACDNILKRSIFLSSDDWAKLKFVLLKNCMTNDCNQSVGALDTLFETIDNALKVIPTP